MNAECGMRNAELSQCGFARRSARFVRRVRMAGCIPLTPALSLGERENRRPTVDETRALQFSRDGRVLFPLPEGEGQGEGEQDNAVLRTVKAFRKEHAIA